MILADPGSWWRPAAIVVFTNFLWGFHQELVYRGILQTELVRRWGPLRGILVSNSLYTFGPLHFYHFSHTHPALPMFAGIFAIGLFFGGVVQEFGQFVDGCHLSWHRQLIYRGHSSALMADEIGCRPLPANDGQSDNYHRWSHFLEVGELRGIFTYL